MARDKICTPFLALASPENKFTVSTIEDMQSRVYLKIGDVVELNGYYTAGDGAGHKRKIEATDDGSGVQLANGLWANIVHNGEVNVSWFGGDCSKINELLGKRVSLIIDKDMELTETLCLKSHTNVKTINGSVVSINTDIIGFKFSYYNKINLFIKVHKDYSSTTLLFDSDYMFENAKDYIRLGSAHCNTEISGEILKELKGNTSGIGLHASSNNQGLTGLSLKNLAISGNFEKCYFMEKKLESSWINTITFDKTFAQGGRIGYHFNGLENSNGFIVSQYSTGAEKSLIIDNCKNISIESMAWDYGGKTSEPNHIDITNSTGLLKIPHSVRLDIKERIYKNNSPESFNVDTVSYTSGEVRCFKNLLTVVYPDEIWSTKSIYDKLESGTYIVDSNYLIHNFGLSSSLVTQNAVLVKISKYTNSLLVIEINNTRTSYFDYRLMVTFSALTEAPLTDSNFSKKIIKSIFHTSDVNSYPKITGIDVWDSINRRPCWYDSSSGKWVYANVTPISSVLTLNTPYHATKMQQEGVYEDFITYMDEKTEYDRLQREGESQPEGVMVLPAIEEPKPSEKLLAFKEKYLG